MKINLNKSSGKIILPDNFVSLQEIRKDGSYVYKIKYQADLQKIFSAPDKEIATTVLVKVVKNEASQKVVKIFDVGYDTAKIVNNLLNRSLRQKEINRNLKNKVLLSIKSDITKRIPNDQLTKLAFGKDLSIDYGFVSDAVSTTVINKDNSTAPILEMNLNKSTFTQESQGSPQEIRKQCLKLIFESSTDPAGFICEKTNTISPALKQHGGVSSTPSQFQVDGNDGSTNKKNTDILIKSLLTKTETSFYPTNDQTEKFVNLIRKRVEKLLTIEETIVIPNDLIKSDNFLLELDLITNDNILSERVSKVVDHSKLLTIIQIPTLPPKLTVISSANKSKNILKIVQVDENASKVGIFRKEIKSTSFNQDEEYVNIGTINVTSTDREVYFQDVFVSSNPVIYRAVSIATNGTLGFEFSSGVAVANLFRTGDLYQKTPNYLVLYSQLVDNRIKLFINGFPPEPIAVELCRRDLSLMEDYKIIDKPILLSEVTPIEVLDDNIMKKNHVYEYKCKLIYPSGTKIDAGNHVVIEYNPIENNSVDTTIQSLVVDQNNESNLDVTFSVDNVFDLTNIDAIKATLASQGITEYDDDIALNKEKLQDLLFTRIVRTNLSTGEIEDFGVIKDNNFSDRNVGIVKSVKPLKPGKSYKYTVIVYSRSSETLIPNTTRVINGGSTNEYTMDTYKYLNPITLSEGNIVSDQSLKRNHSKDQFTIGKIVNLIDFDVSFSSIMPKIQSVKASVFNDKKNVIRWKVQGNTKKIDHFIILLEINEMRTIVGKSHSIGSSNDFKFIDTLDNGESGALSYIVIPVYYDFSRGSENRASTIII